MMGKLQQILSALIALPGRLFGRIQAFWDALIRFVQNPRESLLAMASDFLVIDLNGARRRRRLIIWLGGLVWAISAHSAHPVVLSGSIFRRFSILLNGVFTLFAPKIFRRVLIIGGTFWFAYRWAAVYLDDIFELEDVSVAAKFIRQAAFASHYDVLHIIDGDVKDEEKNSPLARIGGPGRVQVGLEYAALFERADGTPHIIVSTPPSKPTRWKLSRRTETDNVNSPLNEIAGFERLRAVINLRAHQAQFSMIGRTRDGIPVKKEDVKFLYAIDRDGKAPTLVQPYPFDPAAIYKIVYNQKPPENHRDWLKTAEGAVRGFFNGFIRDHFLSQFLAHVNEEEDRTIKELQKNILDEEKKAANDSAVAQVTNSGGDPGKEQWKFVYHDQISQSLIQKMAKVGKNRGLQLDWGGTGTWKTPREITTGSHLQSWRVFVNSEIRGSQFTLRKLRDDACRGHLTQMIQEVPINAYRNLNADLSGEERISELLAKYLNMFAEIVEVLRQKPAGTRRLPEQQLLQVVRYLEILTSKGTWLD